MSCTGAFRTSAAILVARRVAAPRSGRSAFLARPRTRRQVCENIRDGLSQADPAGAAIYAKTPRAYIAAPQRVGPWIVAQLKDIPLSGG